jgi:xanthine permease XanP
MVILVLNATHSRFLRMGAIAIGLGIGYAISILLNIVDYSVLDNLPLINIPMPFQYGLDFDFAAFIPFLLLYILTTLETIGDLTATSAASGEPVEGPVYLRRIKGGVLGDGINSMIAALFNAFPNTTFSQNNGVIQMTGVGSRYIGLYISGIFILLGLLPFVGGVLQTIPQPVLGGATIVMFGTIAVAGIDIIASTKVDRRTLIIVAASLALGIGVVYVPEILDDKPAIIRNIFSSGIATGGLTAMLLNWFFPKESTDDLDES